MVSKELPDKRRSAAEIKLVQSVYIEQISSHDIELNSSQFQSHHVQRAVLQTFAAQSMSVEFARLFEGTGRMLFRELPF